METEKILIKSGEHDLIAKQKVDLSVFDDEELKTIDSILEQVKEDGGRRLYDLSHEESAFNDTSFASPISYNLAENLKV